MKKILLFPLIFVLLLAGCASPKQRQSAQEMRLNLVTDPTTLDLAKAIDLNAQQVIRMLYEGLTRIGRGERPELALASSVEISEDFKTYTFTLRDAKWANGAPITADDFVFSYQRALDPSFPSDSASMLYVIQNGKEIKEGRLDKGQLGVEAVDEKRLRITLRGPIPYFLEMVSMPVFFPLPRQWTERHPDFAQHEEELISSGPFRLVRWKRGDEMLLLKNPHYWDRESVKLNRIQLVMVDPEAELALFLNKELDWAGSPLSSIPVEGAKELAGKYPLRIKPYAATALIRLNVRRSPLSNKAFRRSLGLAIDRKALTEHVLCQGQLPATTFVPAALRLQNRPTFEDNAVEEAKRALQEAALEALPEITLLYAHSKRNHLLAQALQEQWRRALGVKVRLLAMEGKVYFAKLSVGDYDMALGDWIADVNDPIDFLGIFQTKERGPNRTGWENETYKELLEHSWTIANKEERLAVLADAEKILLDEMPIIPLDQTTMVYVHHPKVKGVSLSSLGNIELKKGFIEED